MQFNSYIFILLFMPLMLMAYFVGNRISFKIGKILLIVGSIIFFAYSGWVTVFVMSISLLVNFSFAKFMEKTEKWRKIFTAVPVIVNVSLLV